MEFRGETTVSLKSVTLSALNGKERRCQECGQVFDDGDKVAVFSTSEYRDDAVAIGDDLWIVHIARKGSIAGSCLEDFVARRLQFLEPEPKGSETVDLAVIGPGTTSNP